MKKPGAPLSRRRFVGGLAAGALAAGATPIPLTASGDTTLTATGRPSFTSRAT